MFRLKSIYIKDYKNIHEQTFDFSTNTGYIALIGLNGSGKSNLLEAISIIFDDLYGIARVSDIREYEIQYEIDGVLYTYSTVDEHRNSNPLAKPSSIIACYSGEDLRLWHTAYETYYMQYFKDAIRDKTFSPRIVYINKYCWKIALISLLCSSKPKVKEFLKNILSIDDIRVVDIHLDADSEKRAKFADHTACRWYDYIKRLQDEDDRHWINANVIATTDMLTYGARQAEAPDYIFQFLFLLALPGKNEEKEQTIDKLITDISISINGVSFDNLSEGEKKMILIECITQILGDENSLILLDEPDAHVHIENKKKILETIVQHTGQTILTTHSPIFTTLMSSDNIFPIDKGNAVNESQRDLIIKMANNNINYIDGACIIASKYVIVTEGPDDIYHIKSAISAFAALDSKYKTLENVSYVFTGGAKEVDKYYDEILKSLYDTITKMVFVFDYDGEGREGAKMVQKLIDSGKAKLQYVFYHKTYPVPAPDVDFYLEDFFDRITYQDVQLPNINGVPSFAELKKAKTWAESIKKRIQRHRQENSLTPGDYNGFQEFLNQLILSFGF